MNYEKNPLKKDMLDSGISKKEINEYFLRWHKNRIEFYEKEVNKKSNPKYMKEIASKNLEFHQKRYNEELKEKSALKESKKEKKDFGEVVGLAFNKLSDKIHKEEEKRSQSEEKE